MSSFENIFRTWLNEFWNLIVDGFTWVLEAFQIVFKFIFFTIFDGILIIVEGFFSTLDLSAIAFSYAAEWSHLPSQSIWIINQIALPQALTLLAGAYLIRLTLNLIPAALTRV